MSSGRLAAFFHHPLLELSATRRSRRDSWPEAAATVADVFSFSGILDSKHAGSALYSVRFIYWVEGRMYTGCLKSQRQYVAGDSFPVRYDPHYPEQNSADPVEKLGTGLLITAAATLAALYFVIATRF